MQHLPIKRFYSLDVLRGLAALSVVLWHWQHFFLPLNKQGVLFSVDKQPFFDRLYIFYKFGGMAVELFFCLSGFIFFWLYSQRVAKKEITLKSFSILRLSRLYPLHFATLIFVTLGQLIYANTTSTFFVYPHNDPYHFLLNLFFASSWFEKGFSFNGPIWSVSIEVLLYLMFFAFCRLFYRNTFALFCVVLIGHFLVPKIGAFMASGVEGFFIGGILFVAYEKIVNNGDSWKLTLWLPLVTIILWLLTIEFANPSHSFTFDAPRIITKIFKVIVNNWTVFILFPLTIMTLALLETKRGSLGRRIAIIGDISYSSYLLHFPLQLALVTYVVKLDISQTLFYSPWFMVSFFLVLIPLSIASHRYFEVPMQRFLRRKPKQSNEPCLSGSQ